jgi:hypothetical protein
VSGRCSPQVGRSQTNELAEVMGCLDAILGHVDGAFGLSEGQDKILIIRFKRPGNRFKAKIDLHLQLFHG